MRRPVCPEGQIDIFPPSTMSELFRHPAPIQPVPPLPFARNEEVNSPRAAKILATSQDTVERMVRSGLLSGYQVIEDSTFRIEYASILAYCDALRLRYLIPARPSANGKRVKDEMILPFPTSETIYIQDVATHLDVSTTTVRRLFDSGDLVAYQLIPGEGRWRIHQPSFAAYVNRLRAQAGKL